MFISRAHPSALKECLNLDAMQATALQLTIPGQLPVNVLLSPVLILVCLCQLLINDYARLLTTKMNFVVN